MPAPKRILILVVILAAAGAGAWFGLLRYGATSADPGARNEQVLVIAPGMGINAVATLLHRAGVIHHPDLFRLFARTARGRHVIKAGEYRVSAAMPPSDILDRLFSGDVVLYRVTIPEGYAIDQIAGAVAQAGLATSEAFAAAARDSGLAKEMGIPADTLEGYLFPETYYFPTTATPRKMAAAMVDRFNAVFTDEWKTRAAEQGFSVHQIVTLASIIEKETAHPDERPVIASVFHNRLAKRMRLESDPTVIYGIPDFDGNITRIHLRQETPYNTYRIGGLPPGPIANPGKEALYAALFPAETDYLYFVAKNDGTHHFSTTLAEHNRAVQTYQLGGRRKK